MQKDFYLLNSCLESTYSSRILSWQTEGKQTLLNSSLKEGKRRLKGIILVTTSHVDMYDPIIQGFSAHGQVLLSGPTMATKNHKSVVSQFELTLQGSSFP